MISTFSPPHLRRTSAVALRIRVSGAGVMRDVKELIGIIMRVPDHGEIAEADLVDLAFDAEGELLTAVNAAYIKLLEFTHDRDLRCADADLDREQRAGLQASLNRIAQLCEAEP